MAFYDLFVLMCGLTPKQIKKSYMFICEISYSLYTVTLTLVMCLYVRFPIAYTQLHILLLLVCSFFNWLPV